MGLAKVKRGVLRVGLVSQNFHDVDFAALRPLAVKAFVCGHHPKGRKEALSFGNLKARLKAAVLKVALVHCVYAARSVLVAGLERLDYQAAVLDVSVFGRIVVALQFAVDPAGLVELKVPVIHIQRRAVKLVVPHKVACSID